MYKEITLEDIRKYQIWVLNQVVDFCNEQGLTYFLTGGTLIGAVRHQGYIPWDDDIDISMLREEYEHFIRIFPQNHPNLYLYCPERVKDSIYPFVKVCLRNTLFHEEAFNDGVNLGINIDLFPIDEIAEDKVDDTLKKVFVLRSMGTRKAVKYTTHKGGVLAKISKYVYHKFLSCLSYSYIYKRLNVVIRAGKEGRGLPQKGIVIWGYGKKELVDPSVFEGTTFVAFEGRQYKAPAKYDEWLRHIYGDYMQLPPEEKRISQHPHTRAYIEVSDQETRTSL